MDKPVVLVCPVEPIAVPGWLAGIRLQHVGHRVVVDVREAQQWLPSVGELIAVITGLGVVVVAVRQSELAGHGAVQLAGDVTRVEGWRVSHSVRPLIVRERVRAGQVVSCPDGDVDVRRSISPGGLVVAGGSVRVIGVLGGRVTAGMANPEASIMCDNFAAEFVSIAGVFATGDRVDAALRGRAVWIRLRDGRMQFREISSVPMEG